MNKKQIEALTALRDVMREYGISAEGGNYDGSFVLYVGNKVVAGYDDEVFDINANILNKILEQVTE